MKSSSSSPSSSTRSSAVPSLQRSCQRKLTALPFRRFFCLLVGCFSFLRRSNGTARAMTPPCNNRHEHYNHHHHRLRRLDVRSAESGNRDLTTPGGDGGRHRSLTAAAAAATDLNAERFTFIQSWLLAGGKTLILRFPRHVVPIDSAPSIPAQNSSEKNQS